ncbi:hypothetical protein [Yinghuangia sp. YIM S09857]|uniref:hypothetical protein n=1 Tax=Yinghuangia sp. YIM S09857 TaxID=3436929 RepID=UPI003F53DF2B
MLTAAAAFLLAGCSGGGDGTPDATQPPAVGGATGGADAGAPGQDAAGERGELPEAHTIEEVAELLKPALGPCQSIQTSGPYAKINAADTARGGTQKALCWYQERQFSVAILLVDKDNKTLETFHKDHDLHSSERVGMGFTVTLIEAANPQLKAATEQQLKATGLPYLNCEKDFAPHDGVQIIAAKTPDCRYTPSARI